MATQAIAGFAVTLAKAGRRWEWAIARNGEQRSGIASSRHEARWCALRAISKAQIFNGGEIMPGWSRA